MAGRGVDLNADLGEGVTDDEGLLAIVTSANVACGFHAGDPGTMQAVCRGAAARGIAVGAQVSYRDRDGFGRRPMDVASDQLIADVLEQLDALDAAARAEGIRISYVKPHGALYNRIADDVAQADAVVAAVAQFDPALAVLGLPGSASATACEPIGLRFVTEGFADRAYTPGGRLVPRSEPGAVLTDVADVAAHAVQLASSVESICIHGDTPGAVDLARAVRNALTGAGIDVRRFA